MKLDIDADMAGIDVNDHINISSDSEEEVKPKEYNKLDDVSIKRKAQKAKFSAWVSNRTITHIKEQLRQDADQLDDEEKSSIQLHREAAAVAIDTPREYQTELFERAKLRNTIAVLGTGSGKTMIAILLLRHILDQDVEQIAAGQPHRVAFFLVHSVTLVFQQSSVLKCNLANGDEIVDEFCGAMNTDLWSKNVWRDVLSKRKVIVCTAEVLYQALNKGFLRMDQVNLLIFDEAHHAKANDPYANVIRDFYKPTPKEKRPRIFGMTASPADGKANIERAAIDLEDLLDSRIATTVEGSIEGHLHKAEDRKLSYLVLKQPFETPLHALMRAKYGNLESLSKTLLKSEQASRELGAWASDIHWSFELGEKGSNRAKIKMYQRHGRNSRLSKAEQDESQLLTDAIATIAAHDFGRPTPTLGCLSSKVMALHEELQKHFERPTSNRCIVFVEERTNARILELIFSIIGGPHMHTGLMVGTDSLAGDSAMTMRQHMLTMQKFRKGELNCLFATSVAEEGIDIPNCNLVIRFDLCKTMIQYVQSRGRARAKNSKIIHMHELHNNKHACLINEVLRAERKMEQFCASQTDRLLLEYNHDLGDDSQIQGSQHETPAGAMLNWNNTLTILGYYVATLPAIERGVFQKAVFTVTPSGLGQFVGEVLLPEGAPIRCASGQPCTKKALAKRSAAYEMCMLLIKANHLDQHLMPTAKKLRPLLANAHLALKGQKGNYDMRLKPEIWSKYYGMVSESLYLTTVDVSDGLQYPHQPLGLLTMEPLPIFPEFPMFVGNDKITQVQTKVVSGVVEVSREEIELLTAFALRIFEDVFIKRYEANSSKMSYYMVPILQSDVDQTGESPRELIDWNTIQQVSNTPDDQCRWTPSMKGRQLKNRYMVDPGDAGRRVFTLGVNSELSATDPVPVDCPKRKYQKNILEYSISLWKNSRTRADWNPDQPVIEAELIDLRFDLLAPPDTQKKIKLQSTSRRVVLCPEPLHISPLPLKFVTMCFVMPPIIHRFEDYMIALEAAERIGIEVSAGLALEACTKDSDNSNEHDAEQLNFRPGMGANYERLEFLGDTFLKMATTIALFVKEPTHDEFACHCARMGMLNNANLCATAVEKLKLYEYVRTMGFSRRLWYPPGLKLLVGKGVKRDQPGDDEPHSDKFKHSLSSKAIADVCEAMIGAAFVQHYQVGNWSPDQWNDAVKAVTSVVNNDLHTMLTWQDYSSNYTLPKYQIATPTAVHRDLCKSVERIHNYIFQYPLLLASAMTHPSYPNQRSFAPDYQRLEFLGDSLLDVAFVTHLFYTYPSKDPQWLTEHKGVMVGNRFLATVCVELGLHRFMRHNHPSMQSEITDWVEEVRDAKAKAGGAMDYWTSVKHPQKCLADLVEAYIGAMFIDSNFDFNQVQRFFDQHIKKYFEDMSIYDSFSRDHPMNRLCERLSVELGCRDFHLMSEELEVIIPGTKPKIIAGVIIHDRIVEESEGRSSGSKVAKVKAAKACVEALGSLNPSEFRIRYGCDCQKGVANGVATPADVGTAA